MEVSLVKASARHKFEKLYELGFFFLTSRGEKRGTLVFFFSYVRFLSLRWHYVAVLLFECFPNCYVGVWFPNLSLKKSQFIQILVNE